jgi:hypothetical protein
MMFNAIKSLRLLGVFSAGIALFNVESIQAQLINVDFNGNSVGTAYGGGGGAAGPTQSGAAIIGSAGDVWNGFDDSSFTFSSYPSGMSANDLALTDANGSASGVTMSLTADGSYDANEPTWGNTSAFTTAASPYSNLMEDLIYSGAGNVNTMTLSGLPANQTFDLILYSAGDQNVGAGRTGTFTVNGNTQTSFWDGTTSTLTAGQTYVEFASALSDGSGNLVINLGSATGDETDLTGFQLNPVSSVPEPSTCALLSVAGVALFCLRRKLVYA